MVAIPIRSIITVTVLVSVGRWRGILVLPVASFACVGIGVALVRVVVCGCGIWAASGVALDVGSIATDVRADILIRKTGR